MGGFRAQHAALLVVELDRVACGVVFDANPLGTLLKSRVEFARKIAVHSVDRCSLGQKTQDLAAAKMFHPGTDEAGIKPGEFLGRSKHQVGSVFTSCTLQ